MIKLQGLLSNTFGGFPTIRGIAKFSDLVKLSEAKEYQREIIEEHLEEINSFYKKKENLYFPEIILSLELEYDFNSLNAKTGVNPIRDILEGKEFESNVKPFSIKPLAKRYKNDQLQIVNIVLKDNNIKYFGRVDGNHRLTAKDNENIYHQNIPFCIVLFESDNIEHHEKILFFNINSKSRPLTTEESLNAIFNDSKNFPNEILKTSSSFGWEYFFAKQINYEDLKKYFPNIVNIFDNNFRTTFLKLFTLLLEYDVIEQEYGSIELVNSALSDINSNIYNDETLKNSKNPSIFSAFLFYQLKRPNIIKFLKDWVIKNEIYKIKELETKSIINIMENIANHKVKKIFVAMPYWSHDKVNEYNKLFRETLDEVEKEKNIPFKLELIPIMRNKGESERIDQRLLTQIKECDIFIADLTGVNPNVLYETAYAEGCGIKSLLIKEESDKTPLPFDMDKRQYIPYQKESYYTKIKSIVKNNLPSMLT